MARLDEIGGHGIAHIAEADECDGGHGGRSFLGDGSGQSAIGSRISACACYQLPIAGCLLPT
jgi:hypothetical protein